MVKFPVDCFINFKAMGQQFPVKECLQPVYSSLVLYIGYQPLLTGSHMRNAFMAFVTVSVHLLQAIHAFLKFCPCFSLDL